ncbi:MAG TPA: AMP-binding protein [Gaiellaceae bacterium]|nr:AMP-binding protein [Gaiellaceae bacterium]
MTGGLFPPLAAGGAREAVTIGGRTLARRELAALAGGLAAELAGVRRAAVVATPSLDTVVAVVGALAAGVEVVPLDPAAAARELEHVAADARPDAVLAGAGVVPPEPLAGLPVVRPSSRRGAYRDAGDDGDGARTALVVYTSGTTGPPKGVRIPRRALAANLDALAEAWRWTEADVLAHALPLFHVHGLVLGVLGPLRLGSPVVHAGRFTPAALADALERGATMLFGVPTMYRRLADAAEADAGVAAALARARLLVSGSAALPAAEHRRVERLTGRRIVERYGMTETLMIASARADGDRTPGSVGRPLAGVEVRLADEEGRVLDAADGETVGEVQVRSPSLFTGYLNRPEATAAAFADDWFLTGDLATRGPGGELRLVGRRSTDLIKSGGFKIGAGEVESALLEHPAVAEAAVRGRPDADLGERVVAWVVLREGPAAGEAELVAHAGRLLAPHKRPREVVFVDELPRNAMGKVVKASLA